MHWDDLRFFLSVARAGQMGKAAPGLGADPTTVARRIRRLERDLGETLFEQERNGQRLTQAGVALMDRAEEMERSAAAIGERVHLGSGPSGILRVSASEGFGIWVIARHLHRFAAQYPNVTIDLAASSGFLNPGKRETDMAILLARPRKGPLITRRLTNYTLGLYAARDYLASGVPAVSRDTLRRHRIIGYIPDQIYAPELDYLSDLMPGIEAHLRSSSVNAQHRMCHAGAGLAILPDFIGGLDDRLERVMPEFILRRSFWLALHEHVRGQARVRVFNEWLVALVAEQASLLDHGQAAAGGAASAPGSINAET